MLNKDTLTNYFFPLPAISIFTIFYIIPFFAVFYLSMVRWDGVSFKPEAFVWFENYKEIIFNDPTKFWISVGQAAYITLWALTFQNLLAFMLALACNRAMKMGAIYRTIFFIPPILSEVVVGLVWWWIYDGNWGLLNYWLTQLGLIKENIFWLSSGRWLPLTCVALVHCWKGFGWGFIILLAGLQTIPRELYEAARVDGANAWQRFWKITMPLMIPVIFLVIILTILGTMQGFVLILAMTGGGPYYYTEMPVTRILDSMTTGHFGFACSQAVIFGLMLVVVSFIQLRISKRLKKV
jgi:ABC-type sugar transport system permease subunit